MTGNTSGLEYSPRKAVVVTKSDTAVLPAGVIAFSVGTAGDVALEFQDGSSAIIPSNCLAVGVQHGCRGLAKIKASGTTASEFVVWTM